MNKRRSVTAMVVAILVITLIPVAALAKKPVVETSNNLSFPAIAVDGFSITPLTEPSFTVPYTGSYPGLTSDQIDWLLANGPWYAQKTTGNKWQADYINQGQVDVTYIDWSDNMEGINPKVRSTFRLEIVLFNELIDPMKAYTMAVLEYPNSSTELQGTNSTIYDSYLATVVSAWPRLVIQYLGSSIPENMTWLGTQWDTGSIVPVGFAPELNVGGKYIFGASQGGWKPTNVGYYRITFYLPSGSGVNLSSATIINLPSSSVATAVLVPENNLTYIDVLAIRR